MRVIALLLSLFVATSALGDTRYVSNLVLATGTAATDNSATHDNDNTKVLIDLDALTYITPPAATGIAALSKATLQARGANGLRNLSIIFINSGGTAGSAMSSGNALMRAFKIKNSVNAGGADDHIEIETGTVTWLNTSASAVSPTAGTSRFEIRYGTDLNTGAAQHPGGNASYWTQAYSATSGPKHTITDAYYQLDHTASAGSASSPDHVINVMASGVNYNEARNGATVTSPISGARLNIIPDNAGGGSVNATSWTLIRGYAATPGSGTPEQTDLFPSTSTYPHSNDINAAGLYANMPGIAAGLLGATTVITDTSTSDWGVYFECLRFPNTSGATCTLTAGTTDASVYFSACSLSNGGSPFTDSSGGGVAKVFSFYRCRFNAGNGVGSFTARSASTITATYSNFNALGGANPNSYQIYFDNTAATSTFHIKNLIFDHNDVAHTTATTNQGCHSVFLDSLSYADSARITNNNIKNLCQLGRPIQVTVPGPPRLDIAHNNCWTNNTTQCGMGIKTGADASVENVNNQNISATHKLMFAGAVASSSNYANGDNQNDETGSPDANNDNGDSGYDVITLTDTTARSTNDFQYMLVKISNGPGKGHFRMITRSTWAANVTSLRVNPRWTSTLYAYDSVAASADGIAAPPPTNASSAEIWKAYPSKVSIRDNICVMLRLPSAYGSGTVSSHGMLIGQGTDGAEIVRNIIFGGDDGMVIKADNCLVAFNTCIGAGGCLDAKGGNYNTFSHNNFISALTTGGSSLSILWQDVSGPGGTATQSFPLSHVYLSKCMGNTFENNICAVYKDPTTGTNDNYIMGENVANSGAWQGFPTVTPMQQSLRSDYNLYYHESPADSSGHLFSYNNTNYDDLTTFQAAMSSNAQYPNNDANSLYGDPKFARLSELVANLSDLTGVFTATYASMETDRALLRSYFAINRTSPAAGAASDGGNIGMIQTGANSSSARGRSSIMRWPRPCN